MGDEVVYMVADERREAILLSALNTFSNHGFRGATTKRLARDAGISEGLLYRYFGSKQELYDAVLAHLMATSRPILEVQTRESEADDRTLFARFAEEILLHFRQYPEEMRVLLYATLQGRDLSQLYFTRRVKRYYELIEQRLEAGQREGRYRDFPPAVGARAFIGMIHYHVIVHTTVGSDPVLGQRDPVQLAAEFTGIFLQGVENARKTVENS